MTWKFYAGNLHYPPGEEGNSLLVKGCILGMPELPVTTEIMNSITYYSENRAVPTTIRGEKSPPAGKRFFCHEIKWKSLAISRDCSNHDPRIESHGLHVILTLQYIVNCIFGVLLFISHLET